MGTHLCSAPLPRSYTPLLGGKPYAVPLSEISAETESTSWQTGQFDDSSEHSFSHSDSTSDLSYPPRAHPAASALPPSSPPSAAAADGDHHHHFPAAFADPDDDADDEASAPSSMASASTAPLPRFTKTAPPLADRVAVLVASPLTRAPGAHARAPAPTPAPDRAAARIAARVAAALEKLAAATAAATASASLHPVQGLTPSLSNPREAMIPLVVRSLAEHRRDARVAHPALATLTQLAAAPAFRRRIAAVGGISAVVDVMRIHSLRAGIQSQALLLLANLTHRTPANKPAALNAGALMVIVSAMTIHAAAEDVQAWGCLALRNCTKVDAKDVDHPHAAAAAVEVIANALEAFPKSRTVQIQACVALTNIAALSDVAKARIGAVSAVRVVVDAVHRNIASPSATDAALTCLAVLVTDIDNQRVAVSHRVVSALALALETHALHAPVVARAAACIRFLSFSLRHRELLGAGPVIGQLVAALGRHAGAAPTRTLRELMHALGNTVAECAANKARAAAHGAVGAAVRVLAAHTGADGGGAPARHLAVVEDACRLLYALLVDCDAAHARAAAGGLLSAALAALREHSTQSARVAEHGTAVFVVLARDPLVLPDVRRGAADLASIVRRARAAHPANRAVARQARDLCDALGLLEQEVQLAWPSGLGDPWADAARPRSDFLAALRGAGCL